MSKDKKVVPFKPLPLRELSNEQLKREFLRAASEMAGFPINLDLRYDQFVFSGSGVGSTGKPEKDSVSITIHGRVKHYAYPLAAVRFNRENWEKFKQQTDMFFDSLSKASKK